MELRSIIKKIKYKQPSMNENNKIIAEYLLENYKNEDIMSLKVISKKTGQSNATIVRFCQDLGFSGFNEFRRIIKNVNNNETFSNHELVVNSEMDKDISKYFEKYFEILIYQKESIKELIENKKIQEFVEFIIKSKRIFIGAVNINYNQAVDFKSKLNSIGVSTLLENDFYVLKTFSNICSENDLFLTISLSNQNDELIKFGNWAQKNGATWVHLGGSKHIETIYGKPNLILSFESNESELWNLYSLRGEAVFQILNFTFLQLLNKISADDGNINN